MTDIVNTHLIRVLVVDDHSVVRKGIKAFLSTLSDIELVGEADCVRSAMDQLAAATVFGTAPHVVLMDLVMPNTDGITGITAVRAAYPDIKVVAMTSFGEIERVHAALAAGASGYLLKDADADEVAFAIRAAAAGEIHLDAAVARKIASTFSGGSDHGTTLTEREREVIKLVANGLSNHEIAKKLMISERTARTHVSNILLKIGVASRTQAALWAIKEGFVETA